MTHSYTNPEKNLRAFSCPHCGAYAQQGWGIIGSDIEGAYYELGNYDHVEKRFGDVGYYISYCHHCEKYALWHHNRMVYPSTGLVEQPNEDMPDDIKQDYLEARSIYSQSPRGALALLRLALQKLMIHFGEKGQNLNNDIGKLVQQGKLNVRVQKLMDSIRVFGGEAVHPLEIDLSDDTVIAPQMFTFLNLIVNDMITQPKIIDSMYESMPQAKKDGIVNRDSQKKAQ